MKNLKSIAVPILMGLCLLITSCDKDDEASDLPLIGTTWTLITYEIKGCDDDQFNGIYQCEGSGVECEVLILNEDGTFTSTDEDFTFEQFTYEYTVAGDVLTFITIDGESEFMDVYTFEIDSDELMLSDSDSFSNCVSIETYQGS